MTNNNENIVHINIIEGLLSQVNEHIAKIEEENHSQKTAKDLAFEEMNLFQTTTLHNLRKQYE